MKLETILLGASLPMERCLRQIGTPYRVINFDAPVPEESAAYFVAADTALGRKRVAWLLSKKRHVIIPESLKNRFSASPFLSVYPDLMLKRLETGVLKTFSVGELRPKEEAAAQPTIAATAFFLKLFTQVFESQGLLFPAVSFYPFGYRTLFSFRVDADEYDEEICRGFFSKAGKYSKGTSLFFSAANFLNADSLIRECMAAGFEILSHGFYHHTYKSSRQNLFNLETAADFFYKFKIPRSGFAAPYGRWNQGLQNALETSGYSFSSDFSYDYDGFPSFPFDPKGFSKVLQIPIHPICSGVCLESSARSLTYQDLAPHFEAVFGQKHNAAEPIIFYEHPTAWTVKNFALIDQWFIMAKALPDVWICQMGEFAAWCAQRDRVKMSISQEPKSKVIAVSQDSPLPPDARFALNLYRGDAMHFTQVPIRKDPEEISLANAHFQKKEVFNTSKEFLGEIYYEKSLLRLVKNGLKKAIDFERTTPYKELFIEDLGSLTKKMIRSLDRTCRATSRDS